MELLLLLELLLLEVEVVMERGDRGRRDGQADLERVVCRKWRVLLLLRLGLQRRGRRLAVVVLGVEVKGRWCCGALGLRAEVVRRGLRGLLAILLLPLLRPLRAPRLERRPRPEAPGRVLGVRRRRGSRPLVLRQLLLSLGAVRRRRLLLL